MKVTRQQVLEIFNVLNVVCKKDMTPKGAYAISKNKMVAQREVKVIQEAQTNVRMPEGLTEFNEKRIELCEQFANKNEEGKAVILGGHETGSYDIPMEARADFEKAVDELRQEYQEAFDERDKINKEFEELLQEEIEVDFFKTKLDWLPEKISGEHMEVLMDIIDEG